ncbi:LCP family protein [Clostridium sp. B9]|uniref:LCP family protein n=1 Tax=Clostridium sp. B9 TaxID=3423224 RepID=UPI003D2ED07D
MNKGKVIKITCLTIFFLMLGGVGLGMWSISNFIGKMEKVELDESRLDANEEVTKNIVNIALLGIDNEGGKGRSDSIMILTIDELNKKLKLTSIMRDSYVEIPGKEGKDKINHAYAFGGAELTIKTLNNNFGLNIKDFMAVKMESLPTIIDKLGGVDINIAEDEVGMIDGVDSVGVYTLNGEQALAYARIRYTDGGDARRTSRHRNILNSIFEKLKLTPLEEYPDLISEFLPYVQSSLDTSEVLSLGAKFATLIPNGLEQERFPRDKDIKNIEVDGIYYLDFDNEIVRNEIKGYIFDDKLEK